MKTTQIFGGFTTSALVLTGLTAFAVGFGVGATVAAADGRSTDNGDARRAKRMAARVEAEAKAKAETVVKADAGVAAAAAVKAAQAA